MEKYVSIVILIILYLFLGWLISEPSETKETLKEQNEAEVKTLPITYENEWIKATEHIKKYEGIHDGIIYIGYGHKRTCLDTLKHYSHFQYDSLLFSDLAYTVKVAQTKYQLKGVQSLALGMLMYQYGEGFISKSKLTRHLKNNEQFKVMEEWKSFNKFEGKPHLKFNERRNYEIQLFKLKLP